VVYYPEKYLHTGSSSMTCGGAVAAASIIAALDDDIPLIPGRNDGSPEDKEDEFSDWDEEEEVEKFGSQSGSFSHSSEMRLLRDEVECLRRQLNLEALE
jgi:hypothetical protein